MKMCRLRRPKGEFRAMRRICINMFILRIKWVKNEKVKRLIGKEIYLK